MRCQFDSFQAQKHCKGYNLKQNATSLIGKLGVATAEGRAPRLVVDSSVCGLNARCVIPKRSTLPTAKEIIRCYPLRECQKALQSFSIDVKAAHKRIVLHPAEQGLVGFSLDNRLFFYWVTPFGAVFSAFWWARAWEVFSFEFFITSSLVQPCRFSLCGRFSIFHGGQHDASFRSPGMHHVPTPGYPNQLEKDGSEFLHWLHWLAV